MSDIRGRSDEELRELLASMRSELFTSRFKFSSEGSTSVSSGKFIRRDIARVLTHLRGNNRRLRCLR